MSVIHISSKQFDFSMTVNLFPFLFYTIIASVAGTPCTPTVAASQPSGEQKMRFCGGTMFELAEPQYYQSTDHHNARLFAPNLNAGQPRTVRMIYFLPNDRPYRGKVVQKMKEEIQNIQTFYAEQMNAHGYGALTFRVERDTQGTPKVHQVNGQFTDRYYEGEGDRVNNQGVIDEINQMFDLASNIYFIIVDISAARLRGGGSRWGKNGGFAILTSDYFWAIAHELGHGFGLQHDFSDGAYIMSYGWGVRGTVGRLSSCHAEYLSVHPYFNSNTPSQDGERNSVINIISPRTYPESSQSVPVRLKISDAEGLHQVLLFVDTRVPHSAAGFREVKACRGLMGDREAVITFDYDGVFPSDGLTNLSNPAFHWIHVEAVDSDGNVTPASFGLAELPRDRDEVDEIEIPDSSLRAAIAEAIGVPQNAPIQRAHLKTLIELEAKNANINNLTGLEAAINLKTLDLGGESVAAEARVINSNSVSDLSPLRGLELKSLNLEYNSNISDISAISGMTEMTRLRLSQNSITDISAVAGLTNLTLLTLNNNSISDISAIAGLTNLKWLYLRSNNISNISALSDLTNLKWLILNNNIVSDIFAVAGLTKLERLYLSSNSISEVSAVAGLTKLTLLTLSNNFISDISAVAGLTNLTSLTFGNNNISKISALPGLINLTWLALNDNNLTDISAVAELTKLERLFLSNNSISDISAVIELTNLELLLLEMNLISDISALSGLIELQGLYLGNNSISDISTIANLTNLRSLNLKNNSVSDLSPLVDNAGFGYGAAVNITVNPLNYQSIHIHIPTLQDREAAVSYDKRSPNSIRIVSGNEQRGLPSGKLANPFVVEVRDGSGLPFEGVPVTFTISAGGGTLSATSVTTNNNGRAESLLTLGPNPGRNIVTVSVKNVEEVQTITAEGLRIPQSLEVISGADQDGLPGEALDKPFVVEVRDQSDKPLPGARVVFTVTVGGGESQPEMVTTDENGRAQSTLTFGSERRANTVRVSVEGNTEAVVLVTIEPEKIPMFTLSIPAGTHAIHIPLTVNQINGEEGAIETVGDLYNALGDAVNFIITFVDGTPRSYLGDESAGSVPDADINNDTGLIAVMNSAATLELTGQALDAGGKSQIDFGLGNNLIGVPLNPSVDMTISDLLLVEGVAAIAVSNATGDGFHTITAAGQDGDGPLMGGVGYIVVASAVGNILVFGTAWENEGASTAAPGVVFDGSQTPVLYFEGSIVDEFNMLARIPKLPVTVKNLSTGASLDTILGTEHLGSSYSATFVELDRRAAKAGDVLEIAAHSPNPNVGVRPVRQIVLGAENVLTNQIKLPDVELYEIPSETELLQNYPNPFNPETWIPYRLAKAAKVTLEIYDTNGGLVRSIDVGFKPGAVYESRASAIYWDGRNASGESAASGAYFYRLSAHDYSATRRMVILK